MKTQKSVLTIAVGKKLYVDMALNLAKSYLLWNKDNGIEFILVTDRLDLVKKSNIYKNITIVEIETKDYDDGFAIKLHLDKFIKTPYTLFVDCDCLVYNDLSPVFEKFQNHTVSAIGKICTKGDFFGNIADLIYKLNLAYMPKFVGAVYYVEKSPLASNIFKFARELKTQYDEIGLIRLRNKENEEPLIALSMAKFNQKPILDDGSIKADVMSYTDLKTNLIYSKCELSNRNNFYPTWLTINNSKPLIVHYNSSFTESYQYITEIFKLNFFNLIKVKFIANLVGNLCILYPRKILLFTKNCTRPFYRKIIGIRAIKQTKRV